MTEPKNGDFVGYVNELNARPASKQSLVPEEIHSGEPPTSQVLQWLQSGAPELTETEEKELLEELARGAADDEGIEPISDEEFERQALDAGGSDNDPDTPE